MRRSRTPMEYPRMTDDDDTDGYRPERLRMTKAKPAPCRLCEKTMLSADYVLKVGRVCQRCWAKRGLAVAVTRYDAPERWERSA